MVKKIIAVLLSFTIVFSLTGCSKGEVLDSKNPVTITVWHYYNGSQQQAFDNMVEEFNQTLGKEKGIIVASYSQGDVNGLAEKVTASVSKDVGAGDMPDIFSAYADTAYDFDNRDIVVDISKHLTEEELNEYIPSYIEEGRFSEDGGVKMFPIAKSTEVLMLNKTQWDAFKAASGASDSELSTWEGITAIAAEYYDWTNSLTDEKDDGKAFFGRDAVANYFLIGSMQLGDEIFEVKDGKASFNIDVETMKKLWDNLYVPYVNGYFGAYGRFRSDDLKTGQIAAYVGSTSSAAYFPTEVTHEDGTTCAIECQVLPLPNFKGTKPMAVQQGAGMVVTKSTPVKEAASIEFLKWFTDYTQNVEFSIMSGYMPVKKSANTPQALADAQEKFGSALNDATKQTLPVAMAMTQDYTLYTSNAFKNGYNARKILEFSLLDIAKSPEYKGNIFF
ncbi:MAG: extracellular solute-binding protein, partial [Oscillospiraceae bacterium]